MSQWTYIIAMFTLTSNKLTLIRARFSIKDPIHQRLERSTPKQIICPRGFAPLRKAAQRRASLYCATWQDNACQKALYPHLSAIVHRPVQVAASSFHITLSTRGSLAAKQCRSRWQHHKKPSRAPATLGPGCKNCCWAVFSRPQRR
jgi:hypothetical protein